MLIELGKVELYWILGRDTKCELGTIGSIKAQMKSSMGPGPEESTVCCC